MKTSNYIAIVLCLISISTAAQTNKTVQIGQVKVNAAQQEPGCNEAASLKVMLSWKVLVGDIIENVEVERSFDMVNFHFAGNVSSINPLDEKSNSFCFEDNAAVLAQQPMVQYRIKYTDAYGIVQYSEAKLVGLKS